MSNMAMKAPGLPCTGRMQVLWPPKVRSGPRLFLGFTPMQGLPSSFHGPQIEPATADRAALGSQPVHPEEIIQ